MVMNSVSKLIFVVSLGVFLREEEGGKKSWLFKESKQSIILRWSNAQNSWNLKFYSKTIILRFRDLELKIRSLLIFLICSKEIQTDKINQGELTNKL